MPNYVKLSTGEYTSLEGDTSRGVLFCPARFVSQTTCRIQGEYVKKLANLTRRTFNQVRFILNAIYILDSTMKTFSLESSSFTALSSGRFVPMEFHTEKYGNSLSECLEYVKVLEHWSLTRARINGQTSS